MQLGNGEANTGAALDNYKGIYYNNAKQKHFDKTTGAHFDFADMCGRLEKLLATRTPLATDSDGTVSFPRPHNQPAVIPPPPAEIRVYTRKVAERRPIEPANNSRVAVDVSAYTDARAKFHIQFPTKQDQNRKAQPAGSESLGKTGTRAEILRRHVKHFAHVLEIGGEDRRIRGTSAQKSRGDDLAWKVPSNECTCILASCMQPQPYGRSCSECRGEGRKDRRGVCAVTAAMLYRS